MENTTRRPPSEKSKDSVDVMLTNPVDVKWLKNVCMMS